MTAKPKRGRPKLDPSGRSSEKIIFLLTKPLLKLIDQAKEELEISRNAWMRGACEEKLKRQGVLPPTQKKGEVKRGW